jgi:hypothetical protein
MGNNQGPLHPILHQFTSLIPCSLYISVCHPLPAEMQLIVQCQLALLYHSNLQNVSFDNDTFFIYFPLTKGELCNLETCVIWWQSAEVSTTLSASLTAACNTSVQTLNRLWTNVTTDDTGLVGRDGASLGECFQTFLSTCYLTASSLKVKTMLSSETSASTRPKTRRHDPEHLHPQKSRWECQT